LLSVAYFVTVPLLFDNFGTIEAMTIFLLELGCLGILVAGMVLDNHIVFPDVALSEGRGPRFLVCKGCGCIGSSHALWHILTVIAALKCQASREYALSLQ
jgi:predicted membrane channel-forming protein YqfA (hemolysin III family)